MTWAIPLAALLTARVPIAFEAEIDAAIAETAAIYPVPKALVVAVISVESGFRPRAVSRAGAKGLMQLMPSTARRLGIADADLFDPRSNVLGGVRLLAVLLRHYDGDVISTLVAYNAGPRERDAPVPRNRETPGYVFRVLSRARAHAFRAPRASWRPRLDRPHSRPVERGVGAAHAGVQREASLREGASRAASSVDEYTASSDGSSSCGRLMSRWSSALPRRARRWRKALPCRVRRGRASASPRLTRVNASSVHLGFATGRLELDRRVADPEAPGEHRTGGPQDRSVATTSPADEMTRQAHHPCRDGPDV